MLGEWNMRYNFLGNRNFLIFNIILTYIILNISVCNADVKDYFQTPYDGYKVKQYIYTKTEYSNMPDQVNDEYTSYNWVNGLKEISGINCYRSYSSDQGFFSNKYSVGYGATIDNLNVTLGSDSTDANGKVISTIRCNPYYILMKLNLNVGDSYNFHYDFTSENIYNDSTGEGNLTINIISNEGVNTHYGYYPNTLKYRVTGNVTTRAPGYTSTNSIYNTYWVSSGLGIVRIVSQGDGWKSTSDYSTNILSSPPDSDVDGIDDISDNCPNIPNASQADSDNDNVGDACDNCPNDPNKTEIGVCGCGQPDTDSDQDDVYNCNDAFPFDNQEWADNDNDGIGDNSDPDDDNDLMPDAWEMLYGLNPYNYDANEDKDQDSYTNLEEYNSNTIPNDLNSYPVVAGDVNGDKIVDIKDLILSLKIITDTNNSKILIGSDVNNNGKIGTEDAIYILQHLSGLK